MSQHDFNIANQSFPATRTDLNNALVALASNSSGDAEPATKYANQFWYETDTNTLKLRNEANDDWISIAVLDQSGNAVQSITTAGLTLGSTAISATGAEINQLDAIARGSILYGNASGATARLAKGGAGTVLTSDGTDLSWAAAGGGGSGLTEYIATSGAISNSANSSFTAFDSSKYVRYFFVFDRLIPASNGASLFVRTSSNGGSSYDSGSTDYHAFDGTTDYSRIDILSGNGLGGDTNEDGASVIVQVYQPHNTSVATSVFPNNGVWVNTQPFGYYRGDYSGSYGGIRAVAGNVNAIQFYFSAGNMASGNIKMYGIKDGA